MKRLFILVLVMALLVSLFIGCGTSQESSQATTEESAQSEDTQTTEAAETEEVDYSNIKIGMLLVRTTTDGGWCQAMYEGLMRSVEQLGLTEDQYVVVGELPEGGAEADSTIVQMVDDGCNIIFGTSAGNTVNMTAAYPTTLTLPSCSLRAGKAQQITVPSPVGIWTRSLCAAMLPR